MKNGKEPNGAFDRALDAALGRALTSPQVTSQFRTRLQAALTRASEPELAEVRSRLEREKQEKLAQLDANYVQLRRRTLGTIVGGAFAAGAAVAVAFPWLQMQFGTWTPIVLASGGAVAALTIAVLGLRASGDSVQGI